MRQFLLLGIPPSSWRALQPISSRSIASFSSSLSSFSTSLARPYSTSFSSSPLFTIKRGYATHRDLPPREFKGLAANNDNNGGQIERKEGGGGEVTLGRRMIKEAVRTSYTASAFIFIGLAIAIAYSMFQLLFDPMSENSVFTSCVKRLETEQQVLDALGVPIHTYGYSVRSHPFYYSKTTNEKGNVCVQVEFDIEGSKAKGKVKAEIEQTGFLTTQIVSLVIKLPGWRRSIYIVK